MLCKNTHTHQSRIRKQGFCPGKIGWLIYADFLNQSSEYTFFLFVVLFRTHTNMVFISEKGLPLYYKIFIASYGTNKFTCCHLAIPVQSP